jgi:ribosomal protein S18 acetylase RimI-like enzyme
MNTNKTPTLSFDLRPVTAEDAEFLYRLYCTTREDELNVANFPAEQREPFLRMQFDAQKTHYEKFYPDSEHRIITVGEKSVGREYVNRAAGEILLVDLVLLPEFCNLGIGSILLENLCKESTRTGKPLRLYVVKFNNRALSLYERLGFYEIDDTGVYLLLEWQAEKYNSRLKIN